MPRTYEDIRDSALARAAELLCAAARTAPKTRGQDHLVIGILTRDEKEKVMARMREIAKRDNRPGCERDARCLEAAGQIVVIGVKRQAVGLDCGFCGFKDCARLDKSGGVCAYNSMDLGIALGSAAALAARLHADNRLMYSVGKAALELGLLGEEAVQAVGIPLAASGKNPFFDRK